MVDAVGGDLPLLGEAGNDIGRAALELDELVVDRPRRVEAGAGGVERRGEVFGAALGAVDERFRAGGAGCQHRAHHQSRRQHCVAFHSYYLPSVMNQI